MVSFTLSWDEDFLQVADQATEIDKLRIDKNGLSNEIADLKLNLASTEAQLNECKSNLLEANMKVKFVEI